jgi:hypothetical protein
MLIKKEHLQTLWYDDKDGNKITLSERQKEELVRPENAKYQVSQFPCTLRTSHLELISQEEVNKCKHPRKYIKPTYGWIDGIVGRECKLCHGTQTKKKWHLWSRKWDGYGSREVFAFNSGWNDDLALAIANSGDYTLSEAIIIAARSCERCMNALAHKYGLDWGYEEGSEEWKKCGTSCDFCK